MRRGYRRVSPGAGEAFKGMSNGRGERGNGSLAEVWVEQIVLLVFLATFISMATDFFYAQGKLTLARHSHAALLGLLGGVAFFSLVALVIACVDSHSIWLFSSHSRRPPNPVNGWMGKSLKLSFQLAPCNCALAGAACGILVTRLRRKPRLSI